MYAPRTLRLDTINRILGYLKGIPSKGAYMKNNNSNEVCSYSDVDWAGNFH